MSETNAERWAAAKRDLDYCDSDEDRWKEATRLIMNGDPSDIEPHHLADYQDRAARVIGNARMLFEAGEEHRAMFLAQLREAIADLDDAWPEQ